MTCRDGKSTRHKSQTNEVQILAFPHISRIISSPGSRLNLTFLVPKWKGYREREGWVVGVYVTDGYNAPQIIFETLLVSILREFSLREVGSPVLS